MLGGEPRQHVKSDATVGIHDHDSRRQVGMAREEPPFLAFLGIMREAVLHEQRAAIDVQADTVPTEDQGRANLPFLAGLPGPPSCLLLPKGAALGPFSVVSPETARRVAGAPYGSD